jgi:hypothetical protein
METLTKSSIEYSQATLKRAERALSCSPFKLPLFVAMRRDSIPLPQIAGNNGVKQAYTQSSLSENRVEGDLMWLISVGLLRREVDGQGITDSFRLTPLGRKLIERIELQKQWPIPSFWDRVVNFFGRWLRVPF